MCCSRPPLAAAEHHVKGRARQSSSHLRPCWGAKEHEVRAVQEASQVQCLRGFCHCVAELMSSRLHRLFRRAEPGNLDSHHTVTTGAALPPENVGPRVTWTGQPALFRLLSPLLERCYAARVDARLRTVSR